MAQIVGTSTNNIPTAPQGKFSTSVLRGEETYIFSNEVSPGQGNVIQLRKVNHAEIYGPRETFRVDGKPVGQSVGEMGACLIENGTTKTGVRMYVMNPDFTITEYGLDTPVGTKDKWKKETFIPGLKLHKSSFLNVFGTKDLAGVKYTPQKQTTPLKAMIRLFVVTEAAPEQVTMLTFASDEKWYQDAVEN